MKITLLSLIGSCTFAFGSMAQVQSSEQDAVAKETARPTVQSGNDNVQRATPFWTEDFAAGFPATWTIMDTSGICPWTYSDDGSWGNFNGNGATAGAAPMNSTTAANGFLICDADSANHFTYGQPSGSNYQYLSSYFQTDAINCSAEPSVILSFEQTYRYNNGVEMNVMVSNDNVTWTVYDVSLGVANNTESMDPVAVALNISAIAANQPTVYIRIGWSARVYFWMIDDMALSPSDPNDVVLNDAWWGMGTFDYQIYRIPVSHATPINFQSSLTNNTGGTLTGCEVAVDVSATGSVYSGTTNALDLTSSQTDTVMSTTTWTPSAEEEYTVSYVASTTSGVDGNLLNNNFSDNVIITTSVMGLDNIPTGLVNTAGISNWSTNTGQQFKIGNLLQVTVDDNVECMEIGITDDTQNDGKTIYGEVYAYNESTTSFELRGFTDDYTLTTADLGTVLSLEMLQIGDVYADEEILIVAGHYGGDVSGSDDVRFMYGQAVPQGMVLGYNAAGDLLSLTTPRALVVRANFSCGLGLSETTNDIIISAYPNPASDQLTISIDQYLSSANVSLVDLNGRVVLTQAVEAGPKAITLNTNGLSNGMYTLRVQSNELVSTLKVEVAH
ncbi:MAG: hypothetical protein ACI865_002674 [Flavobacteriaceae bacterium]|jgi:hypothetical protein